VTPCVSINSLNYAAWKAFVDIHYDPETRFVLLLDKDQGVGFAG